MFAAVGFEGVELSWTGGRGGKGRLESVVSKEEKRK